MKTPNLDHSGNERYDGYRREDYVLCDRCRPGDADVTCSRCGGYGEFPKSCQDDRD